MCVREKRESEEVCEREREREKGSARVCVRERERGGKCVVMSVCICAKK